MTDNQPTIICFGEVLWDLLPGGKMAGGAPMNVAYHLHNFGSSSKIISRVGNDENGKEILQFLEDRGVSTDLVQTDAFYPTGTVKVQLDDKGSPAYEIVQPVAWDYINVDLANQKAVKQADAFVFGTLATRNNRTKETLVALLEKAPLKVLDVNLRPPFFNQGFLDYLLQKADIVKMNDEELALIGSWYFDEKEEIALAQLVKRYFQITILIVTQGSKGAFAVDPLNHIKSVTAKKVTVADTIGSGDSFLAGFMYQYLMNEPLLVCLDFAARTGALVATKRGGTPKISEDMVASLG
ncbi:MAG: carbohydrate kinase [Bacteroidota bacterium]